MHCKLTESLNVALNDVFCVCHAGCGRNGKLLHLKTFTIDGCIRLWLACHCIAIVRNAVV